MPSYFRSPKVIRSSLASLWAIGLGVIWFSHAPGPRDGWQPPGDESVIGFLSDGRSMVTVRRTEQGVQQSFSPKTGPIRLWDYETGRLVASHFSPEDIFERVKVQEGGDRLLLVQKGSVSHDFRLRLFDAKAGREMIAFHCFDPTDCAWWIVSDDGSTTAFVTYDVRKPRVECYNVATGRLLRSFAGYYPLIILSSDGTRLVTSNKTGNSVFDLTTGREIFRRESSNQRPELFSPDGRVIKEDEGEVWDVAKGKPIFVAPDFSYFHSTRFSPDSRYLMVLGTTAPENGIAFHGLSDGREEIGKRIRLGADLKSRMSFVKATPDGRLLLIQAWTEWIKPTRFETMLSNIPGLGWMVDNRGADETYLVVDTTTGEVVSRNLGTAWGMSPDGRYVVTRTDEDVYQLWDVHPRRPWKAMLPWMIAWSLGLGLVARLMGGVRRATRSPKNG